MKCNSKRFLAVALLAFLAPQARGDDSIQHDADTGFPQSPATGTVAGAGSFTLNAGNSVMSLQLYAFPPGGGQGGAVRCTVDARAKTWTGSISGLPAGKYMVVAKMLVSLQGGGTATFFTSTATLTVK